jgi:hypothetical protein
LAHGIQGTCEQQACPRPDAALTSAAFAPHVAQLHRVLTNLQVTCVAGARTWWSDCCSSIDVHWLEPQCGRLPRTALIRQSASSITTGFFPAAISA